MKVLVFTTLFPNNIWSNHGIFVKERMTRFARLEGCQVKVVAPVPYFPPLKIGHRWRFSQVHKHEVVDGIDVFHPRYFANLAKEKIHQQPELCAYIRPDPHSPHK